MTSKFEWIIDQQLKRHPDVAKGRKHMADAYRMARRANPALARLLYKKVKNAERVEAEAMFGEGTSNGEGGLAKLMARE